MIRATPSAAAVRSASATGVSASSSQSHSIPSWICCRVRDSGIRSGKPSSSPKASNQRIASSKSSVAAGRARPGGGGSGGTRSPSANCRIWSQVVASSAVPAVQAAQKRSTVSTSPLTPGTSMPSARNAVASSAASGTTRSSTS